MIISCPNCNAGFFVSPTQIGATGRRVKCSKCKNIWHAIVQEDNMPKKELVAERINETPSYISGTNLPAIIPVKIHPFLFAAPLVLIKLILLSFWFFFPSITSKIGLCGPMCVDKNTRIEDVAYNYDTNEKKIIVEYAIANHSKQKISVPSVQLNLINSKDDVLRSVISDGKGLSIEPNSSIKARTEFNDVSKDSNLIQISLGNQIKFWFR